MLYKSLFFSGFAHLAQRFAILRIVAQWGFEDLLGDWFKIQLSLRV